MRKACTSPRVFRNGLLILFRLPWTLFSNLGHLCMEKFGHSDTNGVSTVSAGSERQFDRPA